MTREEKIAAIYKEMANKEKTFGCKYIVDDGENRFIARETEGEELALGESANTFVRGDEVAGKVTSIHLIEIIGHPVMIGDVIDYTGEKKIDIVWSGSSCAIDIRDGEKSLNLFNLWGNKRTPIEDQSDECIDYIYSLIKK